MDRIEDLLRRIRDPRECQELLLAAPREDALGVARQLAAVLSSLPAVHRELGNQPGRLAAVAELVRSVGVLELLLLNLAGKRAARSAAAPAGAQVPRERPENFERVASLVLLALLCTTIAGIA